MYYTKEILTKDGEIRNNPNYKIPTIAGFRLIESNINQLWDWRTLQNIKF